jgi:exoribonuclease R
MLPVAGVDRLAFSVLWDMAADGAILRQWAGRSVIRACAKLAYGHAQAMIEGGCDAAAPPVPLQAPHTWAQAGTPFPSSETQLLRTLHRTF